MNRGTKSSLSLAKIKTSRSRSLGRKESVGPTSDAWSAKELILAGVEAIERLYEGRTSGISTGFLSLDRMTDGLHPGNVVVIAGRPEMGKTAFALNIIEHVAVNCQVPTVIFTNNMSATRLTQKLLCLKAQIDLRRVCDGFMTESDFPRLTEAATQLARGRFLIAESTTLTTEELKQQLQGYIQTKGVRLAVIDDFSLVEVSRLKETNDTHCSHCQTGRKIKELAKSLNIPIVVLVRLGRFNKCKHTRFPTSRYPLRCLSQFADISALIVREEYYAENRKERRAAKNKATLILASNRNGSTTDIPLTYNKTCMRFDERK